MRTSSCDMVSWLALVCASQGLDLDSELDPCAGRYVAKVIKDPHWDLASGGRADFRGKHKSLYNYLSAPSRFEHQRASGGGALHPP